METVKSVNSQNAESSTVARIKEVQRDSRISEELNSLIRDTFNGYIESGDFSWTDTTVREELSACAPYHIGIGVINRLNDIRHINKFLQSANENLIVGEYLVVNVETKNARRKRIINKYPKPVSHAYYLLDFILKRVMPKWKLTYKLYYAITGGRNRVLSKTEALGRLYSCGFKVLSYKRIGYNTWFIAKKVNLPDYDHEARYGFFVKLHRVGLNGEMIRVYKLRTMYPFSEYIQGYIYDNNSLKNGGKLKGDFRITSWGRLFRSLWIDELPMLYNWLKGDMKLVGVRPLSEQYFNLYPEDLQELRTKVYPGLVPPFYADLPDSLEDIMESERLYLESYFKTPIRTDIRYFFKAFYNIVFRGARSK